ncbi:MAG: YicC family protein [Candidatus Pacebacteria bacterium]|nr:YicC family protein [Candidatus Paceibacterota bacterium]
MRSMTGYGRGQADHKGVSVTIEITAVNHKQRDVRWNLPTELAALEARLKSFVDSSITRGAITIALQYELPLDYLGNRVRLNTPLITRIVNQVRDAAVENGLHSEVRFGDIVAIPGVIVTEESSVPMGSVAAVAQEALQIALQQLTQTRDREGRQLQEDLLERSDTLSRLTKELESQKNDALIHYKKRLLERINLLGIDIDLADERLVKELAFAAQKSDITEELVRLTAHCKRLKELLAGQGAPVGRELQFVTQEIQREINTVNAKAADTSLTALGLDFKVELERVREQISNVE